MLVKTHVKSEPAFMLTAGIVSVVVESVPIKPVLPVKALLASLQLAELIKNPLIAGSVNVTVVASVVALMAVGEAGVAVDATVVVMAVGVEARFV